MSSLIPLSQVRMGMIVKDAMQADLVTTHQHAQDILDNSRSTAFQFSEELLHTHLAVFGGTRRGKSKLFELIVRQLIELGRGVAFIDPHSDTADDLLNFLAFNQDRYGYLCNRVHYLRPDDCYFSFDPFIYRPTSSERDTPEHYRRWLHTKIVDMIKILLRNRGETEAEQAKMTRMRTWLYNGLYAVGVDQGGGKHLPLSELFVLLNPKHKRHNIVYRQVEPFLTESIQADFDMLRRMQSPKQIQDFVESTFNQLRQVITPTTERIFSFDRPSIDFHDIIRSNGIVLASLGRTPTFHQDEGNVLAGLIIREISEAVRTIEREKRNQYFMFIDEAQNFLGEDLQDLLKEAGKYRLSCGIAVQSLDNLQQQEIDLIPAVLGQCDMQITFQQQYFQHAEILAKCLCHPWLDFTELIHEIDRDDGYEWIIQTTESASTSMGQSKQTGTSESTSTSRSEGRTEGQSTSHSQSSGENWGESSGTSQAAGHSETVSASKGSSRSSSTGETQGQSKSATTGHSNSQSEGTTKGQSHTTGETRFTGYADPEQPGMGTRRSTGYSEPNTRTDSHSQSNANSSTFSESKTSGESRGSSTSETQGTSDSESKSRGTNSTRSASSQKSTGGSSVNGESKGESHSTSISDAESNSYCSSTMEGESSSESKGTSTTEVPLHKVRTELRHTGSLATSVDDQDRMHAAIIQKLPKRHCVVAVGNRSLVIQVGEVVDPFQALKIPPELQKDVVAKLKTRIFEREPYYHTDAKSVGEQDNRSSPSKIEKPKPPEHGFDID
ncbi:MAG: DUF87 domain-containing protein [Planctomycetota bacterium]